MIGDFCDKHALSDLVREKLDKYGYRQLDSSFLELDDSSLKKMGVPESDRAALLLAVKKYEKEAMRERRRVMKANASKEWWQLTLTRLAAFGVIGLLLLALYLYFKLTM